VFTGEVSLENNGGFASVRERPVLRSLAGCAAFVVRVRGDGRRYKFTARTDGAWDGVVYQLPFTTKAGEWTELRVPFRDLVPTFRGRVLKEVPAFDAARFVSAGFLISDRQAGPFRLEVEWLRAEPSP
jgi:NADH dehydrogenase [ubiquinone] 1 alpha subcomplex assembly factor 1